MSKKSSTFAAENKSRMKFYLCIDAPQVREKASSVPCPDLVPNEAMSIKEMLIRTERGQRLDVNTRMRSENIPDNFYTLEELGKFAGGKYDLNNADEHVRDREIARMLQDAGECFENTPPGDIMDRVDVLRYEESIKERKREFEERRKKAVANASKSVPVEKPKEKEEQHAEPKEKEA